MWGISFGLVRERCAVFEKRLAFRGIMYFWKWLQKEFETGNILAEMKLRRPTISSGIRTKAVVIYLMELDSGNGGTVCKIQSLFRAGVEGSLIFPVFPQQVSESCQYPRFQSILVKFHRHDVAAFGRDINCSIQWDFWPKFSPWWPLCGEIHYTLRPLSHSIILLN